MKTNFFFTVMGSLGLLLGFSACSGDDFAKSCYTCTKAGYSERICQSSYASTQQFKDKINLVRSYGADCR